MTPPQAAAAEAAVEEDPPSPRPARFGLGKRLSILFSGQLDRAGIQNPTTPVGQRDRPGMWNLRQLRVEDVMIPKADVVSVPKTITKDDLVSEPVAACYHYPFSNEDKLVLVYDLGGGTFDSTVLNNDTKQVKSVEGSGKLEELGGKTQY